MSDETELAAIKAWQGSREILQGIKPQARRARPGKGRSAPRWHPRNMTDLPEGHPPEWVGLLMLRPLLCEWSLGWFLCSIGLIFFSTTFLAACVGIVGGNLRTATPATHSTHSLITATRCIWSLIPRLRRLSTSPVQWTALGLCGTLATSGVSQVGDC